MKKFSLFLFIVLGLSFNTFAQKTVPVTWSFDLVKISETEYELKAVAKMQPSWVIYSQFTDDTGPIPTFFMVDGMSVKFEEKSKVIKEYDEMFEVDVMKFKEIAVFIYGIKKSDKNNVTGSVEYMTCDGQRCLPPVEVTFDLKF